MAKKKPTKIPQREVITAKDIENVTGRSSRSAQRMMQMMRIAFSKEEFQFITVMEFSAFSGIDEETIRKFMV